MAERTVRHAGWVGENEFGVATVTGGGQAYCTKPCPECPWRRDVPTGVFPPEAFRISANTAYDMSLRFFACHKSGQDRPHTCAGFILRGAVHNLAYRLACIRGELDWRKVRDGGHPLYASYREMAEANGVEPDDPVLGPCR